MSQTRIELLPLSSLFWFWALLSFFYGKHAQASHKRSLWVKYSPIELVHSNAKIVFRGKEIMSILLMMLHFRYASLCMYPYVWSNRCLDLLSAPFRTQVPHHINSHCYWIEQFLYQHHHIAVIMSLTFRNSVPTNDSCKVQNTIINLQDL